MEIFAGRARISDEFARHGEQIAEPCDILNGHDLLKHEQREALYDRIRAEEPQLVVLAFDCRLWCAFTRLNYSGDRRAELDRLRKEQEPLLEVVERATKLQLDGGRHVLIENPEGSAAWTHPRLLRVQAMLAKDGANFVCDMCTHGLRNLSGEWAVRKPTRLLASHPAFEEVLGRRCNGLHEHFCLHGSAETKAAGAYTRLFAKRVRLALHRALGEAPRRGHTAFAASVGGASGSGREPAPPAATWQRDKNRWVRQPPEQGSGGAAASAEATGRGNETAGEEANVLGARAISFGDQEAQLPAATKQALRRLHQNMGHPANADLARSLRLAGASEQAVRGAKALVCETCRRAATPPAAKPARMPRTSGWNIEVGVDIFFVKDVDNVQYPVLSVVELSTTFHVCAVLTETSAYTIKEALENLWTNWAGPPAEIRIDGDNAFRAEVQEALKDYGTRIRVTAAYSAWQHGRTERHGGWWKHMLARTIEHETVRGLAEVRTACTCVSQAKNSLRRRCGFSPAQWVFGAEAKLPGCLVDATEQLAVHAAASSPASEIGRRFAIRAAARKAFIEMQHDASIRRALVHRARVKRVNYEPGDTVFFWRPSQGRRAAGWKGPAVVIGVEGDNVWVSHAGNALLCAAEHIRQATNEEVWDVDDDVEHAARDLNDLGVDLEGPTVEFEDLRPRGPRSKRPRDGDAADDGEEAPAARPRQAEASHAYDHITKKALQQELRLRGLSKAKGQTSLTLRELRELLVRDDELNKAGARPAPDRGLGKSLRQRVEMRLPARRRITGKKSHLKTSAQVLAVRHNLAGRMAQKQLEKEVPWARIPEEQRPAFRQAAADQWADWTKYGAVDVLSHEQSQAVRRRVPPDRILPARFAYKDKNAGAREAGDDSIPLKPKARLCVGGHRDPDLGDGGLRTDAPTATRASEMILINVARMNGWDVHSGDITAAFLNGLEAERDLFMEQPKEGLPGLEPGQLLEIKKGVFGLATAPRLWWTRFSQLLKELTVERDDGETCTITQSRLDPCLFFVRAQGRLCGLIAVHVDDLQIAHSKDCGGILTAIQELFPVADWENMPYTFVGCDYEQDGDDIRVTQGKYVRRRVEPFPIQRGLTNEDIGHAERKDNMSAIGSVGWLAAQTRPDLACAVSYAQKRQQNPDVDALRATARMVREAKRHPDAGIRVRPLNPDNLCIVVYHDAGWANAQDGTPVEGEPTRDEIDNGTVYSQLGQLVFLTEKGIFDGHEVPSNLVEWRSHTCKRICRSTFAAETMSCAEGVELAAAFRGMLQEVLYPDCELLEARIPVMAVTDCKSLFDTIHREGGKAPAEKRLILDLASLRQFFDNERRPGGACDAWRAPLRWVPTEEMLADCLTKVMGGERLREALARGSLRVVQAGDKPTENLAPVWK